MDSPRQRVWRRRALILGALITLLPTIVFYVLGLFRTPGAFLTSQNYMDRPIGSFWVNDSWGGNGGVTCCWNIKGPTAKVVWILGRTGAQVEQGLEKERHEVELPLPPRKAEEAYLHVRFDPDNKVRIGWSSDLISPFEEMPSARKSAQQGAQQ